MAHDFRSNLASLLCQCLPPIMKKHEKNENKTLRYIQFFKCLLKNSYYYTGSTNHKAWHVAVKNESLELSNPLADKTLTFQSKKKGLSAEEKRARMMEIFFETKDVFQLKDMEKIAPKEKGITAMSVKEVLQSLVDDGMVDCERIGTSNYYWAFPSKALHARKRKLEVLESQLSEGNQKHTNLQKSIEKAKIGRHETEERTMLAKELSSLRDQREQLKAEVEKYKECDPQVVEEIRQANKVAKEAANRWTDNIFAIKSWAKRKFGFEENKIDKNFGIPEDFDYID
ncbi:meiotic nuclear division protein 1 homolog isoform X1 [Zalophus californianus]|nr:meiotic nuclear division protein 1 homolog isoform X1 [Zalophus californianus]